MNFNIVTVSTKAFFKKIHQNIINYPDIDENLYPFQQTKTCSVAEKNSITAE